MDLTSKAKLNNGLLMPWLGLGTFRMSQSEAEFAVSEALKAGYRHIDTAALYQNEEGVGRAIKNSNVERDDIFITTKIWNTDHADPKKAFETSLKKLGTDYIDLYLIHWPVPERNETWKVMEQLLKDGVCKAIGVSNFTVRHLRELLENAAVTPAVNQVEFSPFLYQKELLEFCRENKVQLEAYSPLTRGTKFSNTKLVKIAQKYSKTPAQVLVRWCLQHEVVTIPKSTHKERIIENSKVYDFILSDEDMAILDGMNEDLRVAPDPNQMP